MKNIYLNVIPLLVIVIFGTLQAEAKSFLVNKSNLGKEINRRSNIQSPDSIPLASGQDKWLGNIYGNSQLTDFTEYWNQVTPENAGKWESVERNRDEMNWNSLDAAYDLAKDNDFPFRFHILVWGAQQPGWMNDLPEDEQLAELEEWFNAVNDRYDDIDYLEVVNEPLHQRPDGETGEADYWDALGGPGDTGWDWIIKAFEMARNIFPDSTKLMLNDYNIINSQSNTQDYLEIVRLLQQDTLIDAIGFQGHAFSTQTGVSTMRENLDSMAATGLPVMVTEMDIDGPPSSQLENYKSDFPVFWEHPSVTGITLWGWRPGLWRETAYLVTNNTVRPAMKWLRAYVGGNYQQVSSLSLSAPADSIAVDSTMQLTASISPADATVKDVIWSVETVVGSTTDASISEDGVLTGISAGNTNITVKAQSMDSMAISEELEIAVIDRSVTGLDKPGSFVMYPNPVTNGVLYLKGLRGVSEISVIDLNGTPLKKYNVEGFRTTEIPVHLNPGVYLVKLKREQGTEYQKIIIR